MFKFDTELNKSFRKEFDMARNGHRSVNWFEGCIEYRHDEDGEIWAYPVHGFFSLDGGTTTICLAKGLLEENPMGKAIKLPFNPNQDFIKTKAMVGYMFNYVNNLGF